MSARADSIRVLQVRGSDPQAFQFRTCRGDEATGNRRWRQRRGHTREMRCVGIREDTSWNSKQDQMTLLVMLSQDGPVRTSSSLYRSSRSSFPIYCTCNTYTATPFHLVNHSGGLSPSAKGIDKAELYFTDLTAPTKSHLEVVTTITINLFKKLRANSPRDEGGIIFPPNRWPS